MSENKESKRMKQLLLSVGDSQWRTTKSKHRSQWRALAWETRVSVFGLYKKWFENVNIEMHYGLDTFNLIPEIYSPCFECCLKIAHICQAQNILDEALCLAFYTQNIYAFLKKGYLIHWLIDFGVIYLFHCIFMFTHLVKVTLGREFKVST